MAINAFQVAWISRLVQAGIIQAGDSMLEFSPQDVRASRRAIEFYALRHHQPGRVAELLEDIFDGNKPRATGIPAFYKLFGIDRYRSADLIDARSDWRLDFNEPVAVPERFRIATNFGTAEHVFNIGTMLRSMHDALQAGGIALYVLPTFGDIDHGFYNVHPTMYFDLAKANGYAIEDFHYVDRWDIRNRVLESDVMADVDFESLPIQAKHVLNPSVLKRMVTETFVENYYRQDTQRHGAAFPSVLYDYCLCALRKVDDLAFRVPIQRIYRDAAGDPDDALNPRLSLPTRRRPSLLDRSSRALRGAVRRVNAIRAHLKLRTRLKRLIRAANRWNDSA